MHEGHNKRHGVFCAILCGCGSMWAVFVVKYAVTPFYRHLLNTAKAGLYGVSTAKNK